MKNTQHKHSRVLAVIPAYNEASTIGDVVASLLSEQNRHRYKLEVLVVDDGSKDDTVNMAKRAGALVVSHILNTGAGGATATGLSYAEQNDYAVAVTLDADGQHSAKDVSRGLEVMLKNDVDLLIGSRLIDSRGMSRVKRIGNWGLSIITYLLFGVNVTDSQSGLRVFSKRALKELRWKTSGYEFCSEMLWRAKQKGLVIKEYPIEAIYTDYSKAKGQNNWNAFNIIKSLLRRRVLEVFGE